MEVCSYSFLYMPAVYFGCCARLRFDCEITGVLDGLLVYKDDETIVIHSDEIIISPPDEMIITL
jgi:hypothetical protein